MFLIRTTLLLGLGVLVLPTDPASQARFFDGAKTAMTWTTTFCDRNAATCKQGGDAWAVFRKKAEFGIKMAFDLLSEHNKQSAGAPAPPTVAEPRAANAPAPTRPRGTLQPSDLEPAWRGKVARSNG